MKNRQSKERPRREEDNLRGKLTSNGKSLNDRKWLNMMIDSEKSSRRNIIRKWGTLTVWMSNLKTSNLNTSKRWKRNNWKVSWSKSKLKKSLREKECEMLKDWRELLKPERNSKKPMKNSWKSKLKLLLKKRRKREELKNTLLSNRLLITWRRPRRRKGLEESKLFVKSLSTDKLEISWK